MGKEQLLKNPDPYPSAEVLAAALGDSYNAFTVFTQKLAEMSIEAEWRYYKDGKNWLLKGVYKKKTVFWLSVWDGFFKVSFFFNAKTRDGVYQLPIDDALKARLSSGEYSGKLVTLPIDVADVSVLGDIFTLIEYKKSLK